MKVVQFAVAAVAVIGGMLSSFGAPRYRVELTTSGYAGTETLANFPVLVKFAKDAPVGFDYSQFQPGQTDLSFEDASGNKLAYEIDTWDEEGTSFVWVKVPMLTAATKIIAKWGDPDATADRGAVWSAAGYAGVWHMGETENQGTEAYVALDASGNGMTAEPMKSGTTDFTPMVSRMDGAVGRARVNQDAADRKICLKVDGYKDIAAAVAEGGVVSVSGWFNTTSYQSNARLFGQKISHDKPNGWEVQMSGNSRTYANDNPLAASLSATIFSASAWHHVAFVVRGTEEKSAFYFDGVEKKSGVLPAIVANDVPFTIGNDGDCSEVNYVGCYDEVRLRKASVSTDWIKAEYDTVANADFCEYGTVVYQGEWNAFFVDAQMDATIGEVSPAYGTMTGLTGGQVVSFSAPDGVADLGNGEYFTYIGYELYTISEGGIWQLAAESGNLSGSYTHTAGTSARLIWRQNVFRGATAFKTRFSSNVSIPGYAAGRALTDMPVLFRLSAGSPEGFDYADCQPDGADILFAEANGVAIPHEIEKWDPEGESLIWVRLPVLKTGGSFRFCYGNSDVTEAPGDPTRTWDGYVGVWHMNEALATDSIADATGHGLSGAPEGGAVSEMVSVEGAAGGARQICASGVNRFSVPSNPAMNIGPKFVFGGWIRGTGINGGRIVNKKSAWGDPNGWEVQWNAAATATPRGSGNESDGAKTVLKNATDWAYVVWVYDGARATTYANGEKVGENKVTPVFGNTVPLRFGGDKASRVCYDEFRLSAGVADASRIKVEYDIVANEGFLSPGKVSQSGESDVFSVEAGDIERGEVSPSWGKMTGLTDGQVVPFSAQEGEFETDDPLVRFKFKGYALSVNRDGSEKVLERKDALSGSYTHAEGQSARLVWYTIDLQAVLTTVAGDGAVTGGGYLQTGERATLTAVPSAGMRFIGWKGEVPAGVDPLAPEISFNVDRPYALTAQFGEMPVCAAFFGWTGHAEGEVVTVATVGNDRGSENFAADSVNVRADDGVLPVFSKHHPGVIYTDASCSTVLEAKPGSVRFDGCDISYPDILGWVSRQKAVTVEMFVHSRIYRQWTSVWCAKFGDDQLNLFCPGSNQMSAEFSIEKSKTVATGKIEAKTVALGATAEVRDSWQHLAFVLDLVAQKARFYRNYHYCGERPINLPALAEGAVASWFVGSGNDKVHCLDGWISGLRITKGELLDDEFMRMSPLAEDGDTLVLWDFRGKPGAAVESLKAVVGDGDCYTIRPYDSALVPEFGASRPGEESPGSGAAIWRNAAAKAAKAEPLSKRVGSIAFPGTNTALVVIQSLSTTLSSLEDYTIEFFAKCDTQDDWHSAISWNDIGVDVSKTKPNQVQIPGHSATELTIQSYTTDPRSANLQTSAALTDGQWHHVAVTYEKASDLYTLYFDYNDETKVSISARGERTFAASPFLLGSMFGNVQHELFVGELSCLRISKRALQPSEFMVAGPKPPSGFSILVR